MLVNHWKDTATPTGTLTLSTYAVAVPQGQSAPTSVKTVTTGISSAVALSVTGMPSGVTANFSPATIAAPGSGTATLNIAASTSATPGVYNLTVTGVAGSQITTSVFTLTVLAPYFGFATPVTSLGMENGQTITTTVAVTPQNGFNGVVTLGVNGLPTGVTATFSPATLSGSKAGTSTMSIIAAKTAIGGFYRYNVTATSGTLSQTGAMTLAVNVIPSCKLTYSPASVSVAPGGTSTVALTCPGAGSALSMNTFSVPPGMTATLSSSTLAVGKSVNLTVSATSSAVQGSTVMGVYATETNGAMQQPNLSLTVTGPNSTLALSPAAITLKVGGASVTVNASWSASDFPNAHVAMGGRPDGLNFTFGTLTATGESFTFSAASTAVPGTYTILLQGMSGISMRTANLKVTITK